MALIDEINDKSKKIQADSYSISLEEIISMYKEKLFINKNCSW